MLTHESRIARCAGGRRTYLVLATALLIGLACQTPQARRSRAPVAITEPRLSAEQHNAPATLERSDDVIAAKIARKRECLAANKPPRSPYDRIREWYQDHAGPDGVFRFQEILDAKAHIDRMPVLQLAPGQRDAGLWNWEWLGPGNIGGRIRSIVIHPDTPNVMWIGAVSGGIWKTTNAGASWAPVNDFLPTLAVGCLIMHPNNPNIMFAGTGEFDGSANGIPGAGIFRSVDGGNTWQQLPETANWDYVTRIAISATWSQNILASTNTGVYRSVDTGEHWTQQVAGAYFDVKFHPSDGTLAVAGRAYGGAAKHTTNGGINWYDSAFNGDPAGTMLIETTAPDGDSDPDTIYVASTDGFEKGDPIVIGSEASTVAEEVDSETELVVADLAQAHTPGQSVYSVPAGRVELAWAPGTTGVVYASMNVGRGTIWRSIDGGANFEFVSNTEQNYLGTQGGYDNTIWVSPVDSSFVVVGGIDLWRSSDFGMTLTRISDWTEYHHGNSAHADHHCIVEHPYFDGVDNSAVFFGNDGGIQMTDDIFTVGPTSGWVNLANNLGITQFYKGAASPDGEWILGGTQDNDTLRRGDAWGSNWIQDKTGDGGYCAIDYDDPWDPVFFCEYVYLSIYRRTTWTQWVHVVAGLLDADDPDNSRFIAPFRMDPNNGDRLIAGGTSIWRTTNSAGVWSSIRAPVASSPKCSAIDIAVGDGNIIWVGYDNGHLSRTGNGGSSWVDLDNNGGTDPLPNRQFTDIAINPNNLNEVFVTFAQNFADSVWYTADNGATWQERTGSPPYDLPALRINTVQFHPANPEWVYIGAELGLFASEDRGLTWCRTPLTGEHDGPCNTAVYDLFWAGEHLIAATHGRGMYRTQPLMSTIFVDWRNTGYEDGSYAHPYNTVIEGLNAAGIGATVSIYTGDYNEPAPLYIDQSARLVSRGGTVTIR